MFLPFSLSCHLIFHYISLRSPRNRPLKTLFHLVLLSYSPPRLQIFISFFFSLFLLLWTLLSFFLRFILLQTGTSIRFVKEGRKRIFQQMKSYTGLCAPYLFSFLLTFPHNKRGVVFPTYSLPSQYLGHLRPIALASCVTLL